MGRMVTYISIAMGLSILFYLAGITVDCTEAGCTGTTPTGKLIDYALNPSKVIELPLSTFLIAGLTGVAIAGVLVVGRLLGSTELAFFGLIAAGLLTLGLDFMAVYDNIVGGSKIIGLIISLFFVIFIITVAEWWRGRD